MSHKKLNFIRYKILKSCFDTKEGHLGSAFSILELAYVIFNKFIKKNYFIISKGHASLGVYAIMQNFKYIKEKDYNFFFILITLILLKSELFRSIMRSKFFILKFSIICKVSQVVPSINS